MLMPEENIEGVWFYLHYNVVIGSVFVLVIEGGKKDLSLIHDEMLLAMWFCLCYKKI